MPLLYQSILACGLLKLVIQVNVAAVPAVTVNVTSVIGVLPGYFNVADVTKTETRMLKKLITF